MIGGLIVGPNGGASATVVVRAIGPSLSNFGIAGALQDPTLDLVNWAGVVLRSNNDWRDSREARSLGPGLRPQMIANQRSSRRSRLATTPRSCAASGTQRASVWWRPIIFSSRPFEVDRTFQRDFCRQDGPRTGRFLEPIRRRPINRRTESASERKIRRMPRKGISTLLELKSAIC
jgi:hypothetical protein